jgi:hypothetical protein
MSDPNSIDGVLVQWGDRLFYPGNRMVRPRREPRLHNLGQRAAAIRERIEATIVRRAPQVMVKVTGGGRGMKAIAAHFRYISKNGRLDIEDDRGQVARGKDAVLDLVEEWRFSGAYIADTSERRETFNIMLSMPRGSADASTVQRAAREFAQAELADHKYVTVLHDHQANPHVHISVRAESRHGRRLNPRKADLHRWRETFAEKLRGHGIDAEATRQATRGATRNHPELWRVKAAEDDRLMKPRSGHRSGEAVAATRADARQAWRTIAAALAKSSDAADRTLAASIECFTREPTHEREQAGRAASACIAQIARAQGGPSR